MCAVPVQGTDGKTEKQQRLILHSMSPAFKNAYQMENLESVWFNTSTAMNMDAVDSLMLTCQKLKRVGRLINLKEHAGGARRGDYLHLLQKSRDQNWDIEFVWVSPTRKSYIIHMH